MEKYNIALRGLLVLISGSSLYFMFHMNQNLQGVKEKLGEARKEVSFAQDSLLLVHQRIDSLIMVTEKANLKFKELEAQAQAIERRYQMRSKIDHKTTSESDATFVKMKNEKEKQSKLSW